MPTPFAIKIILVFDLEGYGFNVLWTVDGSRWNCDCRLAMYNQTMLDRRLAYLKKNWPDAEVRRITDFDQRIPEDLVRPDTKVV